PHPNRRSTGPGRRGSGSPASTLVPAPPASDWEAGGRTNRPAANCCPPTAVEPRPARRSGGSASSGLLNLRQDHRHVGCFNRTDLLKPDHALAVDDEAFGYTG